MGDRKDLWILIVEDTELIRRALKEKATHYGFNVVAMENGQDALRALQTGLDVDIVISDKEMPHLTGLELLEELRDLPLIRQPRFLLYTSHATAEERATLVRHKAFFVQKPARLEDVFALATKDLTLIH